MIATDFIELFEDHKLYARSFLPLSSLKSTDIFTEYSYLKHRFDFRVSFDRKILYAEDSERYIYHKYLFNRINLNISYPISKFSRFEISPFIASHKFNDLDYRIFNNTPPPFTYYEKDNFQESHNHVGPCVEKDGRLLHASFSIIYILHDENDKSSVMFKKAGPMPFKGLDENVIIDTSYSSIGEGSVIIFPSNLDHYVKPCLKTGRVTIAFNIYSEYTMKGIPG